MAEGSPGLASHRARWENPAGSYSAEDQTATSDLLVRMAFLLRFLRVFSFPLCIILQQQMKGRGKPALSMNGLRAGAISRVLGFLNMGQAEN